MYWGHCSQGKTLQSGGGSFPQQIANEEWSLGLPPVTLVEVDLNAWPMAGSLRRENEPAEATALQMARN